MTSTGPTDEELAKAIAALKKKLGDYYVQAVQDAIKAEEQRKLKLKKVTTHLEAKRWEKKFEKERKNEKERLQQIKEDHQLLLSAKIAEWKAQGVNSKDIPPIVTKRIADATLEPQRQTEQPKKKISKATLERLSTPRVPTAKSTDARGTRPSSATSSSPQVETSQEVAFMKDVYRKEDMLRLYRSHSLPALNAENLKAMSETDLLQKKFSLLTQLHGVVSRQERIIQDDECTIRSSVSSWKSSNYRSAYSSR
ncbi:TPA: hypothetical protein N0F65_004770 [Lagenidium giganteum]|uniref:Uncharacterized protein n=1 Tax=Lagenidium giganteum TaxID=4803 RepID=A0AAV2YSE4_9STRA|nr:TPA: hypothetical protein N0F65_004770 [Lagenidium giganteum]